MVVKSGVTAVAKVFIFLSFENRIFKANTNISKDNFFNDTHIYLHFPFEILIHDKTLQSYDTKQTKKFQALKNRCTK